MPPRGFLKANPRPKTRGAAGPEGFWPRTQGHQDTSTQAHQYISTPVHQHTTLFHSYSTSTSVNDLHSHSAWQRNSWTLLAFIFLDYSVFTAYSISWIYLKIKMQSLLQWIEGLRDYKWNVLNTFSTQAVKYLKQQSWVSSAAGSEEDDLKKVFFKGL